MLRGLLVALLLMEGVAWADEPLAQARAAVAASSYVPARSLLAAAFEAGEHGPEEVAEIFRLTGIVEAALGDTTAATDAFTRLLALQPMAALPTGTSPKIQRPFDAALRFYTSHRPLEIKTETSSTPPMIAVVVVSDPLSMVARARVVVAVDRGAEQTREAIASDRTELALPAGRRIDARVAALDRHGNRLVEIGTKELPIVIVGDGVPGTPVELRPTPAPVTANAAPASPRRSVMLRWWPYAAATAVFGGATAYFAWSARSDARELDRLTATSAQHSFDQARAVQDRAQRDALYTNIGLGVSAACAITTGVMLLITPRGRETRITAVPVPGGGAIVLGGNL